MERHPEEDHHGENEAEGHDTRLGLLLRKLAHGLLRARFLLGAALGMLERAAESVIDGYRDDERYARHGESEVIGRTLVQSERVYGIIFYAHCGRRCEQRADVDGHIEDRERRIALRLILGIVVQIAYQHLKVALEESRAATDKQQRSVHTRQSHTARAQRQGQESVAEEHDEYSDRDHLAVTELVGQDTADERQEVDEHEER